MDGGRGSGGGGGGGDGGDGGGGGGDGAVVGMNVEGVVVTDAVNAVVILF